jgi:hypothetical protein
MAKSAEVAVKGNTAVALAMNFEGDAHSGFEQMDQDDFALPFLRILTNMSPEIGEVDGASPGMIYNSVTGELFDGKKGVLVIPCTYIRQYIEWAPRGSGSGAPLNIYPATSDILSRTHREPGDNKDYTDSGSYIENTANHYVMVLRRRRRSKPCADRNEIHSAKEVAQVEQHDDVGKAHWSQRHVYSTNVLASLSTNSRV